MVAKYLNKIVQTDIDGVLHLGKKAVILISLVPEADSESNQKIIKDIRKSLKCDWLKEVIKVEAYETQPDPKH